MEQGPYHEPLTARDAWFLYAERSETPLDLGTVYVFEGGSRVPGGRGALGIEETVAERIHLVPRYRQRIHRVPFNLAHPVWVDDPHFDLGAHIRREVLPPPGEGAQLRRLVARILARPLDKRATSRRRDRKSTRLNSSHRTNSYAVFCLKKKNPLSMITTCGIH